MRFGLREFLFVLLLLAMPVAAYFFVFQPRNAQIADARSEVQQKQAKLKQLETATQDINDLGNQIDKLENAIALIEQKLPAHQEVDVVLSEVWKLASIHNLTPKSVRTDKIQSKRQYSALPIKMKIIGDFDGFYEFLLELEKMPRITRLPTMKLQKKGDAEGHMHAEVVLTIFFEGSDQSSGARRAQG